MAGKWIVGTAAAAGTSRRKSLLSLIVDCVSTDFIFAVSRVLLGKRGGDKVWRGWLVDICPEVKEK